MKRLIIYIFLLILCMIADTMPVVAQDDGSGSGELTEAQITEISDNMSEFINEVNDLTSSVSTSSGAQFPTLQRRLQAIDVRWKAYTDLEQIAIAESPILMDILSQYKVLYMAAEDSINNQKARMDAVATFDKTINFLKQCKAKYQHFSSLVTQYTVLPQTADRLEAVKAQEAVLFGQVTESYQKGVAAAGANPALASRMQELEQRYAGIKADSEKIQAAAYKSWLERIKDYVLTFAGVAILLLFINFAISKLKQLKDAREMAKKYGNMLNKDDEYPTI